VQPLRSGSFTAENADKRPDRVRGAQALRSTEEREAVRVTPKRLLVVGLVLLCAGLVLFAFVARGESSPEDFPGIVPGPEPGDSLPDWITAISGLLTALGAFMSGASGVWRLRQERNRRRRRTRR
jgi:hypothetical protein